MIGTYFDLNVETQILTANLYSGQWQYGEITQFITLIKSLFFTQVAQEIQVCPVLRVTKEPWVRSVIQASEGSRDLKASGGNLVCPAKMEPM